ncbi:MAG: argininosuccinate lyase [Methanobacteriota archaeon]|nr:MAG: argininosuccinate lyase [Euryarchaeota archaeon]
MNSRSKRAAKASASELFVSFTSSVSFDSRLWRHDIAGSVAHARSLADSGVISGQDLEDITRGLRGIASDIRSGEFTFDPSAEDLHMHIEKALTERVGDAGAMLHTGRSRNDQVALDMRLYVREALADVVAEAINLQEAIVSKAARQGDAIMPGYTHMQHGQPVLLSHHLLSYFWKLQRDVERMSDCYDRTNVSPLGAGALSGTAFPVDRMLPANMLRMKGITENSLDAVSDRDFVAEAAFALSLLAIHLSSMCEEFVIWSSQEFRFVRLPEGLSGGSSMMPQKRNPDIPELVRAKAGRAVGGLVTILTLLKSLPLAYNRDLQEDKESLFDVFNTVEDSLNALTYFLTELEFDKVRMRGSAETGLMTATDLADSLATRGVPFREAHGIVSGLSECSGGDAVLFRELALDELASHGERPGPDDDDFLDAESSVLRRTVVGGTSPEAVRAQKENALATINGNRSLLQNMRNDASAVDELLG